MDEERSVIPLTKEAVVFYLQSVREKAIPLETQKHTLIEIFIDSVTVYDTDPGYLTLKTAYRLTNIPSKTTRIPISPCSDLGSYGSPLDANPNSIVVVGMVFVQTKRHGPVAKYAHERNHIDHPERAWLMWFFALELNCYEKLWNASSVYRS